MDRRRLHRGAMAPCSAVSRGMTGMSACMAGRRRRRLLRGTMATAVAGAVALGGSAAHAVLTPGDIAIIGYNFDGPDEFAFVALNNISGGEVINFTDNGWFDAGGFRANEGVTSFTAPLAGVTAGTVITIMEPFDLSLSNDGDQILAYQGSAGSPAFIFALHSNGNDWNDDATSAQTSALPPGVPNANIAVPEVDNAVFDTSVLATGNKAQWLAAITNPDNWDGDNGDRQMMPTGPLVVTGATGGGGPLPGPIDPVRINEVRIDMPGGDDDEYFELAGTPGDTLDTLTYIVLGDGGGGGTGVVEAAINLNSFSIPADGYFLAAENTFSLAGDVDMDLGEDPGLNFENDDTVTHLLVQGFTGALGQDLDADDDGALDIMPWSAIFDGLGLLDNALPPDGEFSYAGALGLSDLGPDGSNPPHHVFRLPDFSGAFVIGDSDPSLSSDSPGVANAVAGIIVPEPMTLGLLAAAGLTLVPRRRRLRAANC